MDFSLNPISQVIRSYSTQTRLGELNKKSSVKTVQRQEERVTISQEAKQLLAMKNISNTITEIIGAPTGVTSPAPEPQASEKELV